VAKKILKINTKTKRAHNLRGAAATATGHSRAICLICHVCGFFGFLSHTTSRVCVLSLGASGPSPGDVRHLRSPRWTPDRNLWPLTVRRLPWGGGDPLLRGALNPSVKPHSELFFSSQLRVIFIFICVLFRVLLCFKHKMYSFLPKQLND